MPDDRRLIRRLRRGDADALREIYLAHKDDLLTIATLLLGDPGAAEDVLHEVFVGLAAQRGGPEIRRDLRRYLTTSVANRARDHLRTRARRRQLHPPLPQAAIETAATSEAAEPSASRARMRAACEALGELPPEQLEVVTLHLHGAMTFRDIGLYQGVATDTAKSRYRYAIERLRSLTHKECLA